MLADCRSRLRLPLASIRFGRRCLFTGVSTARLGGCLVYCGRGRTAWVGRGVPRLLPRQYHAPPAGVTRGNTFTGASMIKAGQNTRSFLELHHVFCAASGRSPLTCAQFINRFGDGFWSLIIEKLPVHHDHWRVVTSRVALHTL